MAMSAHSYVHKWRSFLRFSACFLCLAMIGCVWCKSPTCNATQHVVKLICCAVYMCVCTSSRLITRITWCICLLWWVCLCALPLLILMRYCPRGSVRCLKPRSQLREPQNSSHGVCVRSNTLINLGFSDSSSVLVHFYNIHIYPPHSCTELSCNPKPCYDICSRANLTVTNESFF